MEREMITQTSISYYGLNTVVGAPDALKLWDTIGENYKRVLGK